MGTENASDERHPPGSKNSFPAGSKAPQLRKNPNLTSRLTPTDRSSATGARKRSPLQSNDKKIDPQIFRKLDCKRSSDWKVEIAVPNVSGPSEVDYGERDENVPEGRNTEKNRLSKPETKRSLFSKNSDDKLHKFGGYKNGSRVVPCHEEIPESTVASNVTDFHGNRKESEDLSLIRNQLFQIEKQQSSLLDLLQVCQCLKIKLMNLSLFDCINISVFSSLHYYVQIFLHNVGHTLLTNNVWFLNLALFGESLCL